MHNREINEQNSVISIIPFTLKSMNYFDVGIIIVRHLEVTFAIFCRWERQIRLIFFRSNVGMLPFLDPQVNTRMCYKLKINSSPQKSATTFLKTFGCEISLSLRKDSCESQEYS